ncbi:hypothetical protein ACH47Z_18160 [Streptomyces sp. NPDC020192]|uniref:hypothetical protein n=1 Tax=Streptomyces sp. NPDC020192 TaxID=3365066 RepID=UPI0037931466
MSNASQPAVPEPWAQARRIAAEWEEAGRGVDRPTQVARVKAARAARVWAAQESRLKAAVDKAVREALARPEFGQAVDRLAESTQPEAPAPSSAAVPAAVPERPLHEMTLEELRAHSRVYWDGRQPAPYRPLTIGELTAGRYDGDEA